MTAITTFTTWQREPRAERCACEATRAAIDEYDEFPVDPWPLGKIIIALDRDGTALFRDAGVTTEGLSFGLVSCGTTSLTATDVAQELARVRREIVAAMVRKKDSWHPRERKKEKTRNAGEHAAHLTIQGRTPRHERARRCLPNQESMLRW